MHGSGRVNAIDLTQAVDRDASASSRAATLQAVLLASPLALSSHAAVVSVSGASDQGPLLSFGGVEQSGHFHLQV